MKPQLTEIREAIREILNSILEYRNLERVAINGSTRLSGDLDLSSMDALEVMAQLDIRLRTKLPFEKLVAPGGKSSPDLTVDRLAEFAHEYFDERPAGPLPM